MADVKTAQANGITFRIMDIDVKDGDKTAKAKYAVPASMADFVKYAQGLKAGEDGKVLPDLVVGEGYKVPGDAVRVLDWFEYAVNLKARAAVRESTAAEKTTFSRDGKEYDLMDFPVLKLCKALNMAVGQATETGGKIPNHYATAMRKLRESKVAVEVTIDDPIGGGKVTALKPATPEVAKLKAADAVAASAK